MLFEKEVAAYKENAIKDALDDVERSATQYNWHTETDTGAGAGTHITGIPKEDFLDDPTNGGGNLLADNVGLYIRDGLDVLAEFGASGSIVGDPTDFCIRQTSTALQFILNNYVIAEMTNYDSSGGIVLEDYIAKLKLCIAGGKFGLFNDQNEGLSIVGGDADITGEYKVNSNPLLVVTTETTASLTLNAGSYWAEQTLAISKSGYTPIGIVGLNVDGTNMTFINISEFTLKSDGTAVLWRGRNTSSTYNFSGTISFDVLWMAI